MKRYFYVLFCNVESGTCNEDCKFCTQSVRYKKIFKDTNWKV